jgi:NADPH:quinone reductase-like Zn-dependent oxidoreductase
LEFVERPTPSPGPAEVFVRVRAISFNYRDLLIVKDQYNPKLKPSPHPCLDGVGEVAAAGEGVRRAKSVKGGIADRRHEERILACG